MPKVLRHDVTQRTHNDWAVAILVGLLIAGLLGFVAFYPTRALRVSNAAQAETVGLAAAKPEAVPVAKKPVRYEATIENWKRYRSTTKPVIPQAD